ncbi:unnamed protein product, partial [marine sediment metagenome]
AKPGDLEALRARRERLFEREGTLTWHMRDLDRAGVTDPATYRRIKIVRARVSLGKDMAWLRCLAIRRGDVPVEEPISVPGGTATEGAGPSRPGVPPRHLK